MTQAVCICTSMENKDVFVHVILWSPLRLFHDDQKCPGCLPCPAQPYPSVLVVIIISVCMCNVCVSVDMCIPSACVWRSEDNFWKSVLSPLWVLGMEVRSSDLYGKYFYLLSDFMGPILACVCALVHVSVCMCVCMCVMSVCVSVYILCVCVYMCVSLYVCHVCVSVCVCACVYASLCICVCLCLSVCMCVCVCVCSHACLRVLLFGLW